MLNVSGTHGEKLPALNCLKAKIVKLHSDRLKKVLIDTNENDRVEGEKPTLYHILQKQKRCTARTIRSIRDDYGHIQISPQGTIQTFMT